MVDHIVHQQHSQQLHFIQQNQGNNADAELERQLWEELK